ncbi:hypothetical protein N7488_008041 [Penicillium malachiteum]|nr:hypothetical protein N7488_008041 [Penicillium malachiteum]
MKATKKPAKGQPSTQPPPKAPRKSTTATPRISLTVSAPQVKRSRMTTRRMAKPLRTSSSPDPVTTPTKTIAAPEYNIPDHGPIDLKQASAAKATNLSLLRINDNREALCDRANGPTNSRH